MFKLSMVFKILTVVAIATFISVALGAPKQPRDLPRRLYIGPYESDTTLGGPLGLKKLISRIRPFGMNTLALGTRADAHELFKIADREAFYLIFKTTYNLDRAWWNDAIPDTFEAAMTAAESITGTTARYKYLVGYDLRDEPLLEDKEKLCTIIQAVRAKNPGVVSTAVLIGLGRGDLLFEYCRPDVLYVDVYPFLEESKIGDFSMRAFGYPELDFTAYIEHFTRRAHPDTPLWVILQTHGTEWPEYDLRAPIPEELRAMQWMALGEGATGIFYFHWGSMQTWIGLRDNPKLFAEAARFATSVRAHEALIISWRKQSDRFFGSAGAYVSTLKDTRDGNFYTVIVNRDVTSARRVVVSSQLKGIFTDLETSKCYVLGSAVSLKPGEGRIFLFHPNVKSDECSGW